MKNVAAGRTRIIETITVSARALADGARKLGGLAFLVEGTVESLAPKMRFDKPETVPSVLRAFHRALVRKAPFSITLECEADDGQLGAWQVRVTL